MTSPATPPDEAPSMRSIDIPDSRQLRALVSRPNRPRLTVGKLMVAVAVVAFALWTLADADALYRDHLPRLRAEEAHYTELARASRSADEVFGHSLRAKDAASSLRGMEGHR